MRNMFKDFVDYIDTSYKLDELENKKNSSTSPMLLILKHKNHPKKSLIRKIDHAKYLEQMLEEQIQETQSKKFFLEYCLHHPIKAHAVEFDPDHEYNTFFEDENTK